MASCRYMMICMMHRTFIVQVWDVGVEESGFSGSPFPMWDLGGCAWRSVVKEQWGEILKKEVARWDRRLVVVYRSGDGYLG